MVTSHSKPTLKVVPIATKKSVDEIFSGIRNVAKIHGDLSEPETEAWRGSPALNLANYPIKKGIAMD